MNTSATKNQVKKAIETKFDVNVTKVNILNVKGKTAYICSALKMMMKAGSSNAIPLIQRHCLQCSIFQKNLNG